MKPTLLASVVLMLVTQAYAQKFTKEERALIEGGKNTDLMRVLQVTDSADLKVLEAQSTNIDPKDKSLQLLIDRMCVTVNDTVNPGVGIAAPQVGINRNVIWVNAL
jgi:peptide deformylase